MIIIDLHESQGFRLFTFSLLVRSISRISPSAGRCQFSQIV